MATGAAADTPNNPLYHVATPSRWLKTDAVRRGYPFERAFVVYPGAHVKAFEMPEPPATDKLRIVYAGLVNAYKGPQVLLDALYLLHKDGVDFFAVLAGATFDEQFVCRLKHRVNELNMRDKIVFAGWLDREGGGERKTAPGGAYGLGFRHSQRQLPGRQPSA